MDATDEVIGIMDRKRRDMERRIRELEAELAVRDNMGDEVLRILREATGRRDLHSEMEAAEWAAKMLADARIASFKADNELNAAAYDLERQGRELTDARLDSARLDWCVLHKACAVEHWNGGWRVQNIYQVFMTDSHETPRAAIDDAMKTD